MGFLSKISDTLFGGTDDSAQKAQLQANERSQKFIEEQAALNRADANQLYRYGDMARNQGLNAALALMGESLPTQMRMFQDGNVSAQMQMLAGMPQYQNAILGMPVDNSALQPYRSDIPSVPTTQLPNFDQMPIPGAGQPWGTSPQAAPAAAQAQQPSAQQQINYALLLGGGLPGGRF